MNRLLKYALPSSLAIFLAVSPPAVAEPRAQDSRDERTTVETQMKLVGFDVATAQAAGNTVVSEGDWDILKDANGAEIARAPQPGAASTTGVIYGDCGSSYVYIYDEPGALEYSLETGFDVNDPAIEYRWDVAVTATGENGSFGGGYEDQGLLPASTSWDSGLILQTTEPTTAGYTHFAEVIEGQAILINGGVCQSGLPTAAQVVF